jgi:hypothetical protein
MNQADGEPLAVFTPLQGQYLAFIHAYTLVNGHPPAEHEMIRFLASRRLLYIAWS